MRDNGQIRKLAAYVLSDYILLQFHGKKVRDLNEVKKELFYYEKKDFTDIYYFYCNNTHNVTANQTQPT